MINLNVYFQELLEHGHPVRFGGEPDQGGAAHLGRAQDQRPRLQHHLLTLLQRPVARAQAQPQSKLLPKQVSWLITLVQGVQVNQTQPETTGQLSGRLGLPEYF